MTSNTNPFAARLAAAAQEGYIGTPRTYGRKSSDLVMTVTKMASSKQLALITTLMDERDLTQETRPKYRARLGSLCIPEARVGLTKAQASAFIEYLFGMPRKAPATTAADLPEYEIPAGRYAVQLGIGQELGFFQVDRPETGTWAGHTFVTRQVGPNWVRISRRMQAQVLAAIAEVTPKEASIRYGKELGECGLCHTELTNAKSRAAGIGPVCAAKHGW